MTSGTFMKAPARATIAVVIAFLTSVPLAASDPVAPTSVERFFIEAFHLSVQEQVDLCSGKYPALRPELVAASAELRNRYRALLTQALSTDAHSGLLEAEVPQDLFLLYRQQSALRRQVNTEASQERCERTIAEFRQMTDQLLQGTLHQMLSSLGSIIDRRASRSPQ